MPATSREIDVIGRNGPRPTKRRGRNRNTVRNRASKRGGRSGREADFWRRFERLFGDDVKGMRVSLGKGRPDFSIERIEEQRAEKPKGRKKQAPDTDSLTQGGNQEARQPRSAGSSRSNTGQQAPTPSTTADAVEAVTQAPVAPMANVVRNIPTGQDIGSGKMAQLAQIAVESNPKTSNRAAQRGEYPPALSHVPRGFRDDIMRASERTGVNPGLIAAVGQVESGWRKNATSSAGAMGPMQTMPFWSDAADDPRGKFNPNKRPRRAVMLGATILDHYIDQQGSVRKGLMAYNAGPGNMQAGRGYATKVLQTLRQMRRR